jgi:hypothetical protein
VKKKQMERKGKKDMYQAETQSFSYVREHYNKEVRKTVFERVNERQEQDKEAVKYVNKGRKRKQQRVWTLNRSPHGNKTAREQFGRQIWQRTIQVQREKGNPRGVDPLSRRKEVIQTQKAYVSRKEKKLASCTSFEKNPE